MRRPWSRGVVLLAVAGVLGGAGTETRAQYSRRTPVVEAVQKTRPSIVSVKVEKRASWGRKEIGGSGVIVDERGYVVTNRHVVASAERVAVHLADGSELAAEILVVDARHDLAVLRVTPPRPLPALTLAPSSDLMVGETVIAIGHPFGYTNTVSTGIVSYVGREVTMPTGEVLRDLIQITASINPGNSGGPLLNINGELIGINVALREGAQGIAFALSSDTVQRVLAEHLSAVRLAGVSHGLTCAEATLTADGPDRRRVLVRQARGAAAEAGLRSGDQLVRVAGRPVQNRLDVERAVWDRRAGDRVPVTVRRDGRELSLALTLGRAADGDRLQAGGGGPAPPSGPAARLTAAPAAPDLRDPGAGGDRRR